MLWLLAPIVLILICVLYMLSPAKKAARVVKEAVNNIESLQAEINDGRSGCRNDVSAAAADLKDDINRLRLRAISLDELKKHAVGLRLQPLRDVGVRNMEDLQSWGQARLEGLRGVGPKSAAIISGIVHALSLSVKAKPIPDPEPPLARDKERSLVQAIYRELACEHLLAGVPPEFQKLRSEASEAEEHVKAKTRFLKWILTLGKAEEIRNAITLAQDTARSYQKGNDADRICEQVRAMLSACRSVRSNRVETATLVEHYNEEWIEYDAVLGRSMGNNGRVKRTPPPRLGPQPYQR